MRTTLEFVEYTGRYPNLCSGRLFVKINGKLTGFGNYCLGRKGNTDDTDVPIYKKFWVSGGSVSFDKDWDEHVSQGEWQPDWNWEVYDGYPKDIYKLLPRLLRLFNKHVPHGCCGGCV
jgi:hypothetical protein